MMYIKCLAHIMIFFQSILEINVTDFYSLLYSGLLLVSFSR